MRHMEKEFALLGIIGGVMLSVYPLMAIELVFSKTAMFPYLAAVIEELVKAGIILFFINKVKPNMRQAVLYGIIAGVTFGFIENLIYAIRFIPRPDFAVVIMSRFLQPFVIHITSSTAFAVFAKKKMPIAGLLLAIGIHTIYNIFIVLGI